MRTTLAGLAAVDLGPPCTIVIGSVASLDLRAPRAGPLAGTRVVVTRARTQAAELVAVLVDAGAEVIELPVIAIDDPPDGGLALRTEAARAAGYDWVVFTSSNAVDRFLSHLRDGRDLGGARLAVVGGATARALAAHRLVADLVPEEETGDGLVAAMPDARSPASHPGRVLFPRAVHARDVVASGLRRKGWEVTEVDAYRTVPAQGIGDQELDDASHADVITFSSPSTVTCYAELAGHRRVPSVVACIGPVTAEAARRAGFGVDVVAVEPSVGGLVAALSAHLGGPPDQRSSGLEGGSTAPTGVRAAGSRRTALPGSA